MSKKEAGKQQFHMEWSDGNQQLGKLWAGSLMTIWGNICYILTAFPTTKQSPLIGSRAMGQKQGGSPNLAAAATSRGNGSP